MYKKNVQCCFVLKIKHGSEVDKIAAYVDKAALVSISDSNKCSAKPDCVDVKIRKLLSTHSLS